MDRETALVLLMALCGGAAAVIGGLRPPSRRAVADVGRLERLRWQEVWTPLLPAALVVMALVGWALMEPEPAEELPAPLMAASIPFLLVWGRALVRSLRRLRAPVDGAMASTVGLLRPRVVLSAPLVEALDAGALQAAREHELAHVRHRDPLRLWLAELATDLQWPSPAAPARLAAWRQALEFARDDEARHGGVDGADLAAAIVGAARLTRHAVAGGVGLTEADVLEERIRRLLEPLPPSTEPSRLERAAPRLWAAGLLVACTAGAIWGEGVIHGLFGGP